MLMKKPPNRLTGEVKELYRRLNEHRNKAEAIEFQIQEWFTDRGLEMMNEDMNGNLLSFLSGDALNVHENLEDAFLELEEAYKKHLHCGIEE